MELVTRWPLCHYLTLKLEFIDIGTMRYYDIDTGDFVEDVGPYQQKKYRVSETYHIVGLKRTMNAAFRSLALREVSKIPFNLRQKQKPHETASKTYRIVTQLGNGSFGDVYGIEDREGRRYALKAYGVMDSNVVELDILRRFHHPNVLGMRGFHFFNPAWGRVMERDYELFSVLPLANSNLHTWVRSGRQGMQVSLSKMMHGIASGIRFLLKNGVFHLDLKPDNILVFGDGTVKIADFGIACYGDRGGIACEAAGEVFTLGYRPPERLVAPGDIDKTIASGSIVWTLGAVYHYILTGRELTDFDELNECTADDIRHDLENKLVRCQSRCTDAIRDVHGRALVERMLAWEITERPDIDEVLSHPFFSSHPTPVMGTVITRIRYAYPAIESIRPYVQNVLDYMNPELRVEMFFLAVDLMIRTMMLENIPIMGMLIPAVVDIAYNTLSISEDQHMRREGCQMGEEECKHIADASKIIMHALDAVIYTDNPYTEAWSLWSLRQMYEEMFLPTYATIDYPTVTKRLRELEPEEERKNPSTKRVTIACFLEAGTVT